MTTFALAFQHPVSAASKLAGYVRALIAGAAQGYEMARRYEALSRLSDQALAARGLTRGEIGYAAVTGRIGR
jgi:hypothetical protein